MAVNKAHGFPWLVQSFGHAAVKNALRSGRPAKPKTVVLADDLDTSIDQLIRPRREERAYAALREILESDKVAKHEILRIVAQTPRTLMSEEITDIVAGPTKRWVEDNISDLTVARILKRDSQHRVRFEDPIARIIAQLHFEALKAP